ncbi:MAG TPA: aldo/keto reductase [Candidatus Deferrimicrobiaceae bacterium]
MLKRKLGNSGLETGPLAFGGNVFGWTLDETASHRMLDAFVAEGFGLIDTANVYSRWIPGNKGGESETIIGNWLHKSGKRDRVLIATKVGMDMGPDGKGLSRAHILRSAEDSLRRLRTDRIDLYQSHVDDPQTPFEETLDAFATLIRQGKVRAIGASNHAADRLEGALSAARAEGFLPPYETLQPLYNLYDREEFETTLAPLCEREGLGVLTYFSLASGFLSGKYRSEKDLAGRARAERVRKYLDARGMRILEALDRVANHYASAPATVALAWLMSRPAVTAAIASATTLDQLHDLVEATRLTLDENSLELLDVASAYPAPTIRKAG